MSDLLIAWLNDELQLSHRVTNFQQDFQNGYLFGELLSKYNQQLNFNSFINKYDKKSKMTNFQLLFETFNSLRVTFNSNIAMQILQKKPGIAKKVLYELKMQLEKTNSNAFSKIPKLHKTLSPLKKIQPSKDKFDSVNKQHFTKQINVAHRPQKAIIQQNVLKRFSDFQIKQKQVNEVQQQKQMYAKLLDRKKFREIERQNLKKSSDFRMQWENSNVEKWEQNMTARKMQHEKDVFYKSNLQNSKMKNMMTAQENAMRALDNDIAKFEKKIGIQDDSDQQINQPKQATMMQKSTSKLSAKLGISSSFVNKAQVTGSMGVKKRNILGEQNSRHQRQKRRRKMIVQQNKRHQMMEINRRQRCIIATIQQTSKQQKQLQYEIWRAWQNKEIIVHNKKLHDQKQNEKQQTRAINSKFKDEQLLKTFRAQHAEELKYACQRQDKLYSDHKVMQRKQIYNDCRRIVDQFIGITERCYEYQQDQNKEQLSNDFLDQIIAQFMAEAKNMDQVANIQLTNYIKGKGNWNIEVKRESEQIPTDPIVDNAIPTKAVNNVYLGNILKTIFSKIYPENNSRASQGSSGLNDRFCASLLGLQFSGKKTIAKQLKQKFGVNVILIDELIERRLQDYLKMKQKGIEVSIDTEQLVEKCYQGKDIPNRLIVLLLEQEIKNNPRSLIVDYPITNEQATDLTKSLHGIQPQDFIELSRLAKKIREFSRLAEPTPSIIVPCSTKPCGVDFALWIDISTKTSLDRFLGRRWHNQMVYHIDGQIPEVNSLTVGEKASSTILKNNFRRINKPQVQAWFANFGTEVIENIQGEAVGSKVLGAWKNISGQCQVPQLKDRVFKVFEQALEIKRLKKQADQNYEKQKQNERKKNELLRIEKEQLRQKCVLSTGQQLKQQLKNAQDSVDFDKEFLDKISNTWNSIQKNTINCLLQSFKKIRSQQQENRSYIATLKRSFIRLLTREDQKFYLVKEFQRKYNDFFDNQNDMIGYQYTKEELHQRVQDLEDDLLNIIQSKKQEAIEQRVNVMNSGWLQSQMEKFYLAIYVIVQAQLQRSSVSQQLIADFYSKKFMVQQSAAEEVPTEISVDNALQIFKQDGFPRIQKLISEALRLFNRQEDQIEDKNKKGGKGAKKEEKKVIKKGGKEQPEQKGQPTAQQLQMKKAINTEKAIFRYRINVLKQYAMKRIRSIFNHAQNLYTNLQDLYLYTNKVENNSVFSMSKIFRKSIEKEEKIENEVQVNYVQVTESQLVRNFHKPKPIVQPARQQSKKGRFRINSLYEFMQLLTNQSENSEKISTKKLMAFLIRLISNQLVKTLIPQDWLTLKMENYENLIRILDYKNQGYIELWKIFIFAIMNNFNLPSEEELKKYHLNLTNYNDTRAEIQRGEFMRAEAWFDQEQQQVQNARVFERKQHLKHILFEIFKNKDENDQSINIERYLEAISLKKFVNKNKTQCTTYYQYAFSLSHGSQ